MDETQEHKRQIGPQGLHYSRHHTPSSTNGDYPYRPRSNQTHETRANKPYTSYRQHSSDDWSNYEKSYHHHPTGFNRDAHYRDDPHHDGSPRHYTRNDTLAVQPRQYPPKGPCETCDKFHPGVCIMPLCSACHFHHWATHICPTLAGAQLNKAIDVRAPENAELVNRAFDLVVNGMLHSAWRRFLAGYGVVLPREPMGNERLPDDVGGRGEMVQSGARFDKEEAS